MLKRLLSLTFCLMTTLLSFAHDFEVSGIYYNLNSQYSRTVEVTYEGDSYSSNYKYTSSVTIPPSVTYGGKTYSVTKIGNNAFYDCSGLTSVSIPNSVTSIGLWSFYGCSRLTYVTIPNSVTSIGEYAFYKCSGLTSVTIPSSVTSISSYAFGGCSSLRSVTVEMETPISIGSGVFSNRANATLYVPFGSKSAYASANYWKEFKEIVEEDYFVVDGIYYVVISAADQTVSVTGGNYTGSVTIPSSVTYGGKTYDVQRIGTGAFYTCSSLTSVTIPNSVTSIGRYAFKNCSGLTSITIPESVKDIGPEAFFNCSSLTSVTVGRDTPIRIDSEVFSNRANATLHVPFGSKSAYANANYWKEFKEIVEEETCWQGSFLLKFNESPAQTVTVIYHDMSFLPFDVFAGKVTIPSSTTHNGKTYIVTSIDESAFHDYDKMTSVSIPSSVTSIGSGAFRGCSSLTSVTVGWDTPISIGYGVFPNMKNATLHVPAGCKSAYEAADVWKEFKEIIEEYVVGDVSGDNVVDILDYTGVGNYIHGNAPEGFNEEAADVDKNGIIDILDYTGIANIIHTGNIYGN